MRCKCQGFKEQHSPFIVSPVQMTIVGISDQSSMCFDWLPPYPNTRHRRFKRDHSATDNRQTHIYTHRQVTCPPSPLGGGPLLVGSFYKWGRAITAIWWAVSCSEAPEAAALELVPLFTLPGRIDGVEVEGVEVDGVEVDVDVVWFLPKKETK